MSRYRVVRRSTASIGALLAIALVFGVNYLGARHWWRGDWTKTRIYSLSTTTEKVVKGLKAPVRITVFMTRGWRLYGPVNELVNRYRALAPSKIQVEFVDPERNPARAEPLAREFGVRQNTIVFRSGEKKKYVEEDKLAEFDFAASGFGGAPEMKAFKGEEAFTAAILDVTENRVTRVYFSSGHGEPSVDSMERGRGFAQAKQLLARDNVSVAAWDSLGKGTVPADATVIVVAGPKTAFLDPEVSALQKSLTGGGRLLLMLDPVLPSPGAPPSDLGFANLLASYGVRVNADLVIDPANAVPLVGPETVVANRYGTHPIVRSLSAEGLPVLFPFARSVSKVEKPAAAYTATLLVETTAEGWGETELSKLDEGVKKDPSDNPGPVTIALAVAPAEKVGKDASKVPTRPARLVVVGNSRFATNGNLANLGNANLFLNAIHWLAGEEKLIGIAPKRPEQSSLTLTRAQVGRLGLFVTVGLPGLAVVLGVWVWYRRRD